jgi:hypothetical protein
MTPPNKRCVGSETSLIFKTQPEARIDKFHVRPWILPIVATLALIPLLMHKSDSAVLFNKYSIEYSIVLFLYGLNLVLLFSRAAFSGVYQQAIKQPSTQELLALIILFVSVVFLFSFLRGSLNVRDGLTIVLLVGILVQTGVLWQHVLLASTRVAPVAGSLALTLILLESIFALFLLVETVTPKNRREFVRLMTSPELRKHDSAWPQPIPVQKPTGTIRLLGLSDSFGTYGGHTSNYHYLLEGILRRELIPKAEMINLSVPGYDPLHQLAILDRFGMDYNPDIVLYGFVAGTDFDFGGDDIYTYQGISIKYPRTSRYLPHNFLFRDWIKVALSLMQEEKLRQQEATLGAVDQPGLFSEETYLKMQFDRMNLWGNRSKKNIERLENVFPVLDAIRSTAEKNGARFALVIHPDETQVNDDLRQQIITSFKVNSAEYDFDLPQKLLRSYCAARNIPCLDLLPIFRANAKNSELYLLRNSHYNLAGQKLAAVTISQFLFERQLLSDVPPAVPAQDTTGSETGN